MTKTARSFIPANKTAPPIEQQRQIAMQTEAFLAKGGQIQQIPNGVSGQMALGGPSLRPAAAKAT
jgi:hypothetical protein